MGSDVVRVSASGDVDGDVIGDVGERVVIAVVGGRAVIILACEVCELRCKVW